MTDESRELGVRLWRLNRSLRLLKQHYVGRLGHVSPGAVALLEYIDDAGICHGKTLAARAALDPSTVSRAVAALVGQGLVERRPDPLDGRASTFALTAAGRAALQDTHRWIGDVLDQALAEWSPDDVAALGGALGRFAADVDRIMDNNNLEAAR